MLASKINEWISFEEAAKMSRTALALTLNMLAISLSAEGRIKGDRKNENLLLVLNETHTSGKTHYRMKSLDAEPLKEDA